jgi:soluble cytochrome b562
MENLAIRVEDRQDANNLRLMQAVLDQAQEATAQSLDQMAGYFEQQRQLDIQDFQVGYQELADSDYETIRSLQQLATFISYQETVD